MPSHVMSKRQRSSGPASFEVADPMEEMDGELQEGQDPWEHRDRANVTNQLAQASIMGQVGSRSQRH